MEFLDRVGDFFNAATGKIERAVTNIFGTSNERRIKQLGFVRDKDGVTSITPGSILDRINRQESEWQQKSDDELRQTTALFRERLRKGETLDDLLPEAFAAVREAGRRFLQMRHYDVQMIGGYFLHKGMIAEMVTGEGKTLVSTLPAFLNALSGHVHVVTVNDYLARRDMEWMGPIHLSLGLTIGAIQSGMRPDERQKEYACDITYGTNNEFGFDYLRDNMKPTRELQVQGPLDYAIVDEIDNILIDEARTPLIISGPAHGDLTRFPKADQIARQLRPDVDFELKEKEHTCHLTDEGIRRAEELAGVESFYTSGNMEWPHMIDNALKAHHLYKRDINYVVENGVVVIVDEHTGRKMEGRQWSDGLHQAVEAKEKVRVKEETQTLATITLQNYFKLYKKLAGMTGTAMTEAEEFWKIYKLDVMAVPTNRPMQRVNHPDNIYGTEKEKWQAVVEEVVEYHETKRPILVGTTSIETSESLSEKLLKRGIKHDVLNAKQHKREAEIVAQAGRPGAVTIATNMAGRGTDIILGGNPEHMAWEELKEKYASRLEVPKAEWEELIDQIAKREGMKEDAKFVAEAGGLHVIGTERHDSRRIDLQLRGRAGRQGDPGSSRFFLSLDDKLMRFFAGDFAKRVMQWAGLKDGEAIAHPMVTRRVEGAQRKIEERHFEQRKNLLEYDEVMDEQRKQVYRYRQRILDGEDCRGLFLEMMSDLIEKAVEEFLDQDYRWLALTAATERAFGIILPAGAVRGMTTDQLDSYLGNEAAKQAEELVLEQIDENLPLEEDPSTWNWQALTKWANRRFELNVNDSQLKKIGRDALDVELTKMAVEAVARFDFTPLHQFIDEDYGINALVGWSKGQFGIDANPEEFVGLEPEAAVERLNTLVREAYDRKEITFPVSVGMQKYLAGDHSQGVRYNRENLARWANSRFAASFSPEEFATLQNQEIADRVTQASRSYLRRNVMPDAVADALPEDTTASEEEEEGGKNAPILPEKLDSLLAQVREESGPTLERESLTKMSAAEVRRRIIVAYDERSRPELRQAEIALLRDVLDSAWKDHLYYMGHLRQSVGFMSYAQKDPRTEYKREGRLAFNRMWERVAEQATGAIFRLESQAPEFVRSLWTITGTVHEEASEVQPSGDDGGNIPEPGTPDKAIEPIVNTTPRVGRNDPCPCNSGRKYKKCCGKTA